MALASAVCFDLDLLRLYRRTAGGRMRTGRPVASTGRGCSGVDLSLPAARHLASTIRAAGGSALIVPSAYRTSMIPHLAALRIAEQHLEVLRLQRGGTFSPLVDGETYTMWWRFYTDHVSPTTTDPEPELVCIDVDRVDGHIGTVADERRLAEWQQDTSDAWLPPLEEPSPPPSALRPGVASIRAPEPPRRAAPECRVLPFARIR